MIYEVSPLSSQQEQRFACRAKDELGAENWKDLFSMWWYSTGGGQITKQSGGYKTKSMKYDTQGTNMQLKAALNHCELATIHFSFSACAAHLSSSGGFTYMSCSVFASVTSNELRPRAVPSWAPQSQNNCVSHSVEPVELQSESIVESHAPCSASPDMQKQKGNMEMMFQIISYVLVSFGLPFLSAFRGSSTVNHFTWLGLNCDRNAHGSWENLSNWVPELPLAPVWII